MNLELPRVGENRIEEGFRLRPFTAVFVMVLALAVVGGLLATFVFADTADEKSLHALLSFSAVVLVGLILAGVVRREEREPFPLFARKALWWLLLIGYFVGVFFVMRLAVSPFVPRLQALRLAVGIVPLAPIPVYAWRLLRREKRA